MRCLRRSVKAGCAQSALLSLLHAGHCGRHVRECPHTPAAPQVLGAVPPARLATAMLASAAGRPGGGAALSVAAARDAADEALVSRLEWLREWTEGVAERDPDDSCRRGGGRWRAASWWRPCADPRCWWPLPAAGASCRCMQASPCLLLVPAAVPLPSCRWQAYLFLQDDGGWRAKAAGAPGSWCASCSGQRPGSIPP